MRRPSLLIAIVALVGAISAGCGGDSSASEKVAAENLAYSRLVVFEAEAPNLVPPDSSDAPVIFLRDRVARTTELISGTSDGAPADVLYGSEGPFMSADGRFVVFESDASNLVTGQPDCIGGCVFVRDRKEGITELVAAEGEHPAISADGRFVTFDDSWSVFIHDRETGATDEIAEDGEHPVIDADGRRVAYRVCCDEVFVRDLDAEKTEHVSVSEDGQQTDQQTMVSGIAISGDGRFVAFSTDAWNLVAGDRNGVADVFVRDLRNKTTERVSVASDGAQAEEGGELPYPTSQAISSDGRFVAFDSQSSTLVPGDTNNAGDVFVRARQGGTTERVSVKRRGVQLSGSSELVSLSPDGRFVVFASSQHIFIYDRKMGTTERVDVPIAPTVMGEVTLQPSVPRAGHRFIATAPVTVNGQPVAHASVGCKASIAGRAIPTAARSLSGGAASCTWALPSSSGGDSLEGEIAATTPNGRAERAVRVDIAGTREMLAWRVVASGAKVPHLNDVVALSPSDVWAVGGGCDDDGKGDQTTPATVIHWNGNGMSKKTFGDACDELNAVAAIDADDVWALGDIDGPVALHWDGRQWKRVQLPSLKGASLSDVAAIAGDDVWIVGSQGSRPLTMHWDGRGWRVYDMRGVVHSSSYLDAVDGVSGTAVWAVGVKNTEVEILAGLQELILRWDGRQWKQVSVGQSLSERTAIDALSKDDIWTLATDTTYEAVDYILHWDGRRGKKWMHDGPWGIAAGSPTSVFAVGWYDIVHWDGKRWRAQPSAFLAQHDTHLEAVSAPSADEAWAVGDHLIVRYSR